MTRDQAAEALYRAGKKAHHHAGKLASREFPHTDWDELGEALAAYDRATPSPLPAGVARGLEAALDFRRHLPGGEAKSADGYCVARDIFARAVDAYRSSQPEPLSARLARLKPGSVVEAEFGVMRFQAKVLENDARLSRLRLQYNLVILELDYRDVTAILSEVA